MARPGNRNIIEAFLITPHKREYRAAIVQFSAKRRAEAARGSENKNR